MASPRESRILDKHVSLLGDLVFENKEHQYQDVKNCHGVVIGKYEDLWKLYTDGILLSNNAWRPDSDVSDDPDTIKRELKRVAAKIEETPWPRDGAPGRPQCAQQ